MADLATAIKKLSTAAVEAASPVDIFIGQVKTVDPISVQISPQIILQQSALIFTNSLSKIEFEIDINKNTEEAMDGDHKHSHGFLFNKTYVIRKELEVNDMVVLLSQKGGQVFVIIDSFGGGGA